MVQLQQQGYPVLSSQTCPRNARCRAALPPMQKGPHYIGNITLNDLENILQLESEDQRSSVAKVTAAEFVCTQRLFSKQRFPPAQIQFSQGSMLPMKFILGCSQAKVRENLRHVFKQLSDKEPHSPNVRQHRLVSRSSAPPHRGQCASTPKTALSISCFSHRLCTLLKQHYKILASLEPNQNPQPYLAEKHKTN